MLGPLALAGLPVGEETQSEGSKQALQRFAMKTNHPQPPLALCVHEAFLHTDTQYTAEAGMTRRGGRPMLTSHPVCTSSHQYLLLSPLPSILPYSPTSLLHHYSHHSPLHSVLPHFPPAVPDLYHSKHHSLLTLLPLTCPQWVAWPFWLPSGSPGSG